MTEFYSVILNGGLTSVFRDLIVGRLDGRKARRQAVISEQSSRNIYPLSWERVSEGQERVNTMLPTPSPSLIRKGDNIVSRFTFHTSLKSKLAFTLAEGATHVALLNNQRKIAFTLAEVLITLGIIGVVAAMTMPSLINDKQNKELEVQFKKSYSEAAQVTQRLYAEEGISMPEYSRSVGSVNALVKFLSYYKGATKVSDFTYSDHDDESGYNTPYKLYPFSGNSHTKPICDISGYRTEVGGRMFLINDNPTGNNQNGPVLCIDVNGKKLPNRYGKDFFLFVFTTDGTLIPMGASHKDNVNSTDFGGNYTVTGPGYCKNTTNAVNQYACAYYALADIHPQDSGKSYWKDFINER